MTYFEMKIRSDVHEMSLRHTNSSITIPASSELFAPKKTADDTQI